MSTEAKKREVLQLLKDWRTWHSAFGAAASTDAELNLDAKGSYGPAGMIFTGAEFDKTDRKLLEQSFLALWGSLTRMQRQASVGKHSSCGYCMPGDRDITGSSAYSALIEPYLSDPADFSIVQDLRDRVRKLDKENKQRQRAKPSKPPKVALVSPRRFLERHDAAIEWLAKDLQHEELHVVWPARMTSQEEKEIDRRNDELYALYARLRDDGKKKTDAVKVAADMTGYSERRAWDIVTGRQSA